MRYTNKLNLPESFVNFNNNTREFDNNRYSVTELLNSAQEILLTRKYYNEIEKDVSDIIPALFGSAVHSILEKNTEETEDLKAEYKIECNIGGKTLVGIIDLLDLKNFIIKDYKTCSVSKISKGDFEDWKKQGLAYAYMLFIKYGIIIKKLEFYALLKDWSKVKSATASNYPQTPIYVWQYIIKDSDYDYIETWIKRKLASIENYNDEGCSDEERWYTGTVYAVYKNSTDKKATALCESEQEAHGYISNKLGGAGEIRVRLGENLKCKYYCDVCKFCKQYKKEIENGN